MAGPRYKKKPDPLNARITVRLTDAMYKEVIAAAKTQSLTLAQYVADALTAALVESFKHKPARRDAPVLTQLVNQKPSHRREVPDGQREA